MFGCMGAGAGQYQARYVYHNVLYALQASKILFGSHFTFIFKTSLRQYVLHEL